MNDNRIVEAVHSITRTLSSTLDHQEGLRRTLEAAMRGVDAAGGSIWQHDPENRLLVCRHVVGEKAAELLGFVMGDAEGIAGDVFQSRKARSDNDFVDNPQHARRVDEMLRYETCSLVTIPLCYPGGVAVGVMQLVNKRGGCFTPEDWTVLEIVADISAMSMHNADLARQASKTEALAYVAGFAHDIYNKLASFVTGLPTLRMLLEDMLAAAKTITPEEALGRLRADAFAFIGYMEKDADLVYRYARFIARLATDKPLDTRFEQADLVETAREQVEHLRRAAMENDVALRFVENPPVFCVHDRLLIGSAVYNLVNNALPEANGGTVQVNVREEDGSVVLEVRDTGCGIPADVLDRILHGNPVSTKPGGSGIGTMIVKKVAEVHRGKLEGESTEGRGATFRIRLPLQPSDSVDTGEERIAEGVP